MLSHTPISKYVRTTYPHPPPIIYATGGNLNDKFQPRQVLQM